MSNVFNGSGGDEGPIVLVFKHGKIPGNPVPLKRLLEKFEKEHTGIKVKGEVLPASTDEQHQFYQIVLIGVQSGLFVRLVLGNFSHCAFIWFWFMMGALVVGIEFLLAQEEEQDELMTDEIDTESSFQDLDMNQNVHSNEI